MKTFSKLSLRHLLSMALLGCMLSLISGQARAGLVGHAVGGCFLTDASSIGLTTNVASCLAAGGQSLSFTVSASTVEFSFGTGGRKADLGDNSISIIYGVGSNNVLPDLFIFTGLDVDGPLTGLTLSGSNAPGITTTFTSNSAAFLVPEVCASADCNFNVTFNIGTTPPSTVPLPGTLALASLGLSALGFARRKKA